MSWSWFLLILGHITICFNKFDKELISCRMMIGCACYSTSILYKGDEHDWRQEKSEGSEYSGADASKNAERSASGLSRKNVGFA